jgi:hypothetical protein
MCLACEEDGIWLAYLESKGLLKADDPEAVAALFGAFPVQPLPMREEPAASAPREKESAKAPGPFSCDDPTAG